MVVKGFNMSESLWENLHVLVIDDEVFMRKLIERTLRDMEVGLVTMAENGIDGLMQVKRAGSPIDVIICDLEMPEMNGFDFVKTLRSDSEVPNTEVPVLIVTGHADEETVRNAASLGINGYLVKPISKKALETRLAKAINP
jgi:CheY-like chemotaxis protein